MSQCGELKVKRTKLPEAREDAGDQVVIGFSFASDWPRMWHEFSAPSTELYQCNARLLSTLFC